MALREAKAGPWLTTMGHHREPQRQRDSGPLLVKPALNWGTWDRYIKLMNLEMEVSNILETNVYKLSEKEKEMLIKKLV